MTPREPSVLAELRREIGSLAADLRRLAMLHWELARSEAQAAVRPIKRLAIALLVFGVMALTALPLLAVAAAELLAGWLGIPGWGWMLIFAAVLLVAAALGAYAAWRRFRRRFAGLEQTLEELREDLLWLRDCSGHEVDAVEDEA